MNELTDLRTKMNSAPNMDFDKVFEKQFSTYLTQQMEQIKQSIKDAVRHNPSMKTVSCTVCNYGTIEMRDPEIFDGTLNKTTKYYSVQPYGTDTCRLVMDRLFRMEYQSGWLNKSYAMVLTPLGEKYVSGMQRLCRQNGIEVSFDAEFACWFKGNAIRETVRVGSPFSPRGIYQQEMDRFCLRLTARVRF